MYLGYVCCVVCDSATLGMTSVRILINTVCECVCACDVVMSRGQENAFKVETRDSVNARTDSAAFCFFSLCTEGSTLNLIEHILYVFSLYSLVPAVEVAVKASTE